MLKRELNVNFKSFVIWSAIIVSFMVMYFAMYPSMTADTDALEQMLQAMPKGLLEAFGFDISKFSSALGFYSSEPYMMVTLLGSVYASMLGANILSKEASDKTSEYLLSKPVTRSQIITAKYITMVIYIIAFNVMVSATSLISLILLNDFNFEIWLYLSIAPILMALTFSSLVFLISVFIKKSRKAMSVALGISIGTYFLLVISRVSDKLEFLKYLSPYEYFDSNYIYDNKHLNLNYLILSIIIVIITTALSYFFYSKKDID